MIDAKTIHQHVEDGLDYLKQLGSIELDDYFDIRVEARIRQIEREGVPFLNRVPRLAFIIVLCFLNFVSFFLLAEMFTAPARPSKPQVAAYVETMDATYSVDQNNLDQAFIDSMKGTGD